MSPTTSSKPKYLARVFITFSVCGYTRLSTKKRSDFTLPTRCAIAIASAAAVASSKSDAPATSKPVKSMHTCWKFNRASKRPCAISA